MPTMMKSFARFQKFRSSKQELSKAGGEKLLGYETEAGEEDALLVYEEQWYIVFDGTTYSLVLGSNDWCTGDLESLEWKLWEYSNDE